MVVAVVVVGASGVVVVGAPTVVITVGVAVGLSVDVVVVLAPGGKNAPAVATFGSRGHHRFTDQALG